MHEVIETKWLGGMAFETAIDQFTIVMDAASDHGGDNLGHRPKPMILSALAGCTGMDIVSILRKKRVEFTRFNISIDGELTESHPKYYHKIHLVFEFAGPDFENNTEIMEKVKRAVELSSTTYCGVNEMLRHAAAITHEIRLVNV